MEESIVQIFPSDPLALRGREGSWVSICQRKEDPKGRQVETKVPQKNLMKRDAYTCDKNELIYPWLSLAIVGGGGESHS